MSPELETLDQQLCGDLTLQVVRGLYPDAEAFAVGVHALLRNGDVRLLSQGTEVPPWRWRALFETGVAAHDLLQLKLSLTDQGARRIG